MGRASRFEPQCGQYLKDLIRLQPGKLRLTGTLPCGLSYFSEMKVSMLQTSILEPFSKPLSPQEAEALGHRASDAFRISERIAGVA